VSVIAIRSIAFKDIGPDQASSGEDSIERRTLGFQVGEIDGPVGRLAVHPGLESRINSFPVGGYQPSQFVHAIGLLVGDSLPHIDRKDSQVSIYPCGERGSAVAQHFVQVMGLVADGSRERGGKLELVESALRVDHGDVQTVVPSAAAPEVDDPLDGMTATTQFGQGGEDVDMVVALVQLNRESNSIFGGFEEGVRFGSFRLPLDGERASQRRLGLEAVLEADQLSRAVAE
jgi:hypothetical protein